MNRFHVRLIFTTGALLHFSVSAFAGTLDDYYLQQFGEAKNIQLQKAVLSATMDVQEPAICGMPLKHGLRRDWNLLEQTTQKVLAKQLALPALASEAVYTSNGGHFKVHYATTGSDAPPLLDANANGIPDWVETVGTTFEYVYASYASLGYRPAPTTSGVPYDIYLLDLAPQGYYGTTTGNVPASSASYPNAYTSWMELDNNFTDSIYRPGTYTPIQSLQITAAHEYHHAVQYGYTYYFDVWYAEATSTWMEDELYDPVNQLYSYIPGWFSQSGLSLDIAASTSTGGGYGRWIFNRYLAEKHGASVVRSAWENVARITSPNGNDISMAPVLDSLLSSSYGSSLGNDFFGFTKRVYTRDWTTHTSDVGSIHPYSPVATYTVQPINGNSSPTPSVTLPHYSFAFYKLTTPSAMSFKIYIAKSGGIQTALFRKSSGEIAADFTGGPYTVTNLNSSDEVALLIANTTSGDGENANFSTDGSLASVATPTSPSSSSTSHGCFIATAAYGSYLHPQVRLLRNFRDEHLLTNAPGRAFVASYYRFSPPLADFIARHPLLRGMTRLALTPLFTIIVYPLASTAAALFAGGILCFSLRHRYQQRVTAGERC
ncbi:MAG: hypothetical protein PHI31_07335 [Desulfuromonadaceae bacterium]|nr:hypothetical protein [Desulfuromonadaceae bacterium]